jgi:hypothetical protein
MDSVIINVDNKNIQVATGTNLLSCLRSSDLLDGLCYHSALNGERNCGLCLVEVEDGVTGQRELVSSCQKTVTSPLKIFIENTHVKSVRQSILSLWLHHFSNLGIFISSRLSLKISRLFKATPPLILKIASKKRPGSVTEKWSSSLSYQKDLCIGCGLCVDFVWQSQKENILSLQVSQGQFVITKQGLLNSQLEKSLSLVCPTEAIEHSLSHRFSSSVFPVYGQWQISYQGETFLIRCENKHVYVEPTQENPFLSSSIYELIQRYQSDLLFKSLLHYHSALSTKRCAWYLGIGLPQSTLETIDLAARRRREKIRPLFSHQNIDLQSHPLAVDQEEKAILVLGPDDEITPEDLALHPSVGMVVLSRFNQWRGRPMSDYPDIIWAPHPDIFEFEGDERFTRHFSHVVKRLLL